MKTIDIGSILVFFTTVAGVATSTAFADHPTASVSAPQGTSVPGCETNNECFVPYDVTIDVGGEVTWSNDDSAAHTVTAGSAADGPSGEFDSSLFMVGATFSHKFEEAGVFPYFCMVHPWMQGIVTVQAAEAKEDTHENDMEMTDEVSMEGTASANGMLSDGTIVSVWTSEPIEVERMEISIEFKDSEHVNLDFMVT
ncbi:MAG: plastocyanin/azurin family copper-binding protein [Nitrosopumilaceae archaeon]